MTKLIIILSFVIISCKSEDAIQMREIQVFYVKTIEKSRLEDGQYKQRSLFLYRSYEGLTYELEGYHGERFVLNVRR